MNFYAWAGFINAVTALVAGLFVGSRHQRDPRRITFVLFMLSIGTWAFFYFLWQLAVDEHTALFLCRALVAGALFAPVTHMHHVSTLVGATRWRLTRRLILFGYVSALVLLIADTTPLVVRGVAPRLFFPYWPLPGPLWYFYTLCYFGYWAYTVRLIYHGLIHSSGAERNQLRCLLIGTLLAFAGASTNFLLWYDIPIPPVGSIIVPFYVVLVALAAIRYQFMNIRIVITQTGLLLGTYMIVLGAPFILGWFGQQWLESRFGQQWWLVPLGLCTTLATVGPFAYAYLRRQAEARLLREQRRYQRTLQLAARGMTRVRDVNKLANLITRLVSHTVRLTHASLFLWDPTRQRYFLSASHGPKRLALQSRYELETSHPLIQRLTANRRAIAREEFAREPQSFVNQELEQLEASLAVPGMIEDHLVGFLALGSKVSGEGYSTDDLHAFATLANEAAIAIENAMSYEELLKMNQQLKVASDRLLLQERQAAAGQFAAGMAHEIKNPLSAIKTFAQYLPERYRDPKFRETFFRIVQSQIDRINELVLELSAFAKPSPLQLQAVQLSELVKEILSFLSNQCLQQKVEIRNAVKPNGLLVAADPQQLRQVLLNLFLNSLEAMTDGGRLEVASQPNGSFLTLRISDTGCGIGPEEQRQVWDPFFTTKERGMGLGLAIVKGIIERHGGRIHLSSAPGKGTVVEITLPTTAERVKTSPRP